MAKFNLTLPKMGESVDEATIVSWLKNVGDKVSADDFVVEIATDKLILRCLRKLRELLLSIALK